MRDLIKEQLKKVTFANLNNYNEETHTFLIPKYSKARYELNKTYVVKVPPMVVNNTTSVLATNWNNSTAPKYEYLKVWVSKILGKMIYVDSLGYDNNTKQDIPNIWSGWLNMDEITQIEVL